jgi:aspartate-semialdehyde dehydrogenase
MYLNKYNIGIIGATGAVGQELIELLFQDFFPKEKLFLFSRSNQELYTSYGYLTVNQFELAKLQNCQIIFLCVNSEFSKKYAGELVKYGYVIDNSSAFRYEPNIPLVIPEINYHTVKKSKLISNPNCTTAIALIALYPIYQSFGLEKVIISTYQAASGAGKEGILELESQIKNPSYKAKIFPKTLAYNVIPHIDSFQSNGYTKEEMKVVWEIKKILEDPNISISCTAVRVPTLRAHSESITIETSKDIDFDKLLSLFEINPNIILMNNNENCCYPTPVYLSKKNQIGVGRIRPNLIFSNKGIDLFVCGDQLLRGAALNALLIAKKIAYNNS